MAYDPSRVEVKSKFESEYRRFPLIRDQVTSFDDFHAIIGQKHRILDLVDFTASYTDPIHGDLLPINNDDNFKRALQTATPLLRLFLYRKSDVTYLESSSSGLGTKQRKRSKHALPPRLISTPQDFRRISSIVDADLLPETHRRVKLLKHASEKPLGFYIRDGTSVRVTPQGLERVPGIFISRLVSGGLAESTGLLAVNDEVIEVNGIEVAGKTLDQVTDMMVANSQNLIITVKPVQQPQSSPSGRKSSTTLRQPSPLVQQTRSSFEEQNGGRDGRKMTRNKAVTHH